MISKQRLKELIEQGATIYKISKETFIAGVSDLLKIDKIPSGLYSQEISDRIGQEPDYDLLFETEEDARWELEMTATRTETLKLPTWEEFITNDKYNYYGSSHFSFDNYRLIVKLPSEDDDCEFIGIDVDGNTEIYDWEEATKENYIEACKLCLKLFKGEEV